MRDCLAKRASSTSSTSLKQGHAASVWEAGAWQLDYSQLPLSIQHALRCDSPYFIHLRPTTQLCSQSSQLLVQQQLLQLWLTCNSVATLQRATF
jgi:hypothetical protein